MTKEQEFHSQRMMFVITETGELRVAEPGSTLSHREWFAYMPSIDYEKVVRGYFKDGIISFYTGGDRFEKPAMCPRFYEMAKELGATQIWLGAVPDEPGKQWKPIQIIYIS